MWGGVGIPRMLWDGAAVDTVEELEQCQLQHCGLVRCGLALCPRHRCEGVPQGMKPDVCSEVAAVATGLCTFCV